MSRSSKPSAAAVERDRSGSESTSTRLERTAGGAARAEPANGSKHQPSRRDDAAATIRPTMATGLCVG